jgi:SnoaL-like domain
VPDTLETLIAKQAITEVLYRYCYSMDRIDPELGRQIWHPDGLAHYGEAIFDGPASEYLDQVFAAHRKADATSHQLSNITITVDGEQATSESYVHACIRTRGQDVIVRGRYLDMWSRRQGEWRIDERRYENDLTQIIPANDTFPP